MTLSLPSQSLSVGNVTTLLGQNVGDLQKARSHPTISSWLRSLNQSALGELGLDKHPTGPTRPTHSTTGTPSTTLWTPHPGLTSHRPGGHAPSSGTLALPLLPGTVPPLPCVPQALWGPLTNPGFCLAPSPILCCRTLSICLLGNIWVTLASPASPVELEKDRIVLPQDLLRCRK